ncbi:hypothetical protein ACFE04_028954 [Oxalis oulophora]
MESDLKQQYQNPMNSSLTRYSSAPSSVFSNLIDKEISELTEFLNRPSSPETEQIFARFLSSNDTKVEATHGTHHHHPSEVVETNQIIIEEEEEEKPVVVIQQQTNFYPNHQHFTNPGSGSGLAPVKNGGGNNSSLIRHSSTPADFFAYINVDPGYSVTGGSVFSSASKPPIAAGRLSPISEMGNISTQIASTSNIGHGENRSRDYPTSFPTSPLDDSSMCDSSNRLRKEDRTFSGLNMSETKMSEGASRPPRLAHHMSLPANPSAELSSIEKFLHFSDSVPCKIRAKRGMATHPRSIAERVRRTKISERMRKLQELVPNMDKQTNTADMLDLAVDYIKELQRQHKTLSEHRAKCTCATTHS